MTIVETSGVRAGCSDTAAGQGDRRVPQDPATVRRLGVAAGVGQLLVYRVRRRSRTPARRARAKAGR